MKIHFVWPISFNKEMILMSEILINSAKNMNVYFTILVQEEEYQSASKYFQNIADVVPYVGEPEFLHPWVLTPKWGIEPKGDIILGLDADIVVFNQKNLLDHVEKAYEQKVIYGTIAHENPFSEGEWEKLFHEYGMRDKMEYIFEKSKTPAPYYINNGAVLMPVDLLDIFRFYHRKWIFKMNERFHNLFYISQVATTFALKESGLPFSVASKYFNYLESANSFEKHEDKIALFHYNKSKANCLSVYKIKNKSLKNKIIQYSPKYSSKHSILLL